jgi:hypothetical protein
LELREALRSGLFGSIAALKLFRHRIMPERGAFDDHFTPSARRAQDTR